MVRTSRTCLRTGQTGGPSIRHWCGIRATAIAARWSYRQLLDDVHRLAAGLSARGIAQW